MVVNFDRCRKMEGLMPPSLIASFRLGGLRVSFIRLLLIDLAFVAVDKTCLAKLFTLYHEPGTRKELKN